MKKAVLVFFTLSLTSAFMSSCKKEVANAPKVKVIHAVPNVPDALTALPAPQRTSSVNVFAFSAGSTSDSTVLTSALFYPQASNYETVKQGSFDLRVRPFFLNLNVIAANGVNFANDGAYTVIAYDSVAKIKAMVLNDNLSAPSGNNVKIRFLHLSANAPAVDIVNLRDNQAIFSNRTFADNVTNSSKADFIEVAAGTYNLEVRLAGTSTSVLPINNLILQSGRSYTIWATGFVGGTSGRQLQVLVDQNR